MSSEFLSIPKIPRLSLLDPLGIYGIILSSSILDFALDMPTAMALETGCWWRFDQYEISPKGIIMPWKRARLERYDPWTNYHELKGKRDRKEPPYQAFLQLCAALYPQGVWRSPFPVARGREQLVLNWCNQHGLLGILLEYTFLLNLHPAHRPRRRGDEPDLELAYVKRGARRFGYGDHLRSLTSKKSSKPFVILENFADHSKLVGGFPPFDVVTEPLPKTWHLFFPRVPNVKAENYNYPFPYTDEFWWQYGEPLEFFVEFVRFFYEVAARFNPKATGGMDFDRETERNVAAHVLSGWTGRVSNCLDYGEDGLLRQYWLASSLLTTYATMLQLDLLKGGRLGFCTRCQNPFLSNAYQAKYCSPTCRNTVQKRRHRARSSDGSSTPCLEPANFAPDKEANE